MKTKLFLIPLFTILISCQAEHCWDFVSTTVPTNVSPSAVYNLTTTDTTIYCGITEDEAHTMSKSMATSYQVGNIKYTTTVVVKEK